MKAFYVHWNGGAWFVKTADFFREQGGHVESWGERWHPLRADTIEHARDRARLQYGVHGERWPP